jgi:hypothetical protein
VELSFQGQLHRYLSSLTDMSDVHSITRSGGVPLSLAELASLLEQSSPELHAARPEEARR